MSLALWWVLLAGCSPAPTDALTWRESWQLLGLTTDGGWLDVRITSGNTGLLRGQGHLRMQRWLPDASPIRVAIDVGPVEVEVPANRGLVRMGPNWVGQDGEGGWAAQVRSDDGNGSVFLRGSAGAIGPVSRPAPGGQWTVGVPVALGELSGGITAAERGGLVQGRGVALHRAGDGRPPLPHTVLWAAGPRLSVGVDHSPSGSVAWAWREGEDTVRACEGVELTAPAAPTEPWTLQLDCGGPVTLSFVPDTKTALASAMGAHLLPPEHAAARQADLGLEREVQRGRAKVGWDGEQSAVVGLLVTVK